MLVRKETHCWIKDHLSTEERILNTLWQQNTTGKRKRLDKEQWKDRIKTNTRLHLLECSEYFTTLFLKSMSQQQLWLQRKIT